MHFNHVSLITKSSSFIKERVAAESASLLIQCVRCNGNNECCAFIHTSFLLFEVRTDFHFLFDKSLQMLRCLWTKCDIMNLLKFSTWFKFLKLIWQKYAKYNILPHNMLLQLQFGIRAAGCIWGPLEYEYGHRKQNSPTWLHAANAIQQSTSWALCQLHLAGHQLCARGYRYAENNEQEGQKTKRP